MKIKRLIGVLVLFYIVLCPFVGQGQQQQFMALRATAEHNRTNTVATVEISREEVVKTVVPIGIMFLVVVLVFVTFNRRPSQK
jgi:hypothetical protein